MTQHKIPSELIASADIPPPTLSRLSFCNGVKAAKVAAWADGLLATQITHTSVLLYKSLPEICQLKTDPENRLAMLEAVRASTQNVIDGLTKEFLHQALSASESAQKTAIVAQALQKSMIDGYTLCVREISAQKRFTPAILDQLAKAIHRAITGIGLLFLRSYQLYTHPPAGLWLRLHTLFQTAEYFDLLIKPILDPMHLTAQATNIQSAYTRVLMMATAKLNQVGKNEIYMVYYAFENWSLFAKLLPNLSEDKENLFVANLSRDLAPEYKSRLQAAPCDRVIELNFQSLLALLTKQSSESDEVLSNAGSLKFPPQFPKTLLNHIVSCWSGVAQRQQERKDVQGTADVCIGLVDCHQNAAGGLSFEEFNRMGDLDTGALQNTIHSGFTPAESKTVASRPTYRVTVQNISAGGFCLLWKGETPSRLQAGEIVGIKLMGKRVWSLGVIRWVRQLKQASQLGIQTITEHPKVAGAAQMYDLGGYSDFMRAFIVSAQKGSNGSASIITAAAPFKELDKAKLYDGEEVIKIKLDRCLFATANIRQFAYRPQEGSNATRTTQTAAPKKRPAAPDSFDDTWE